MIIYDDNFDGIPRICLVKAAHDRLLYPLFLVIAWNHDGYTGCKIRIDSNRLVQGTKKIARKEVCGRHNAINISSSSDRAQRRAVNAHQDDETDENEESHD
ncbi:hypothetical protein SDC9_137971 [bioreactor metagenome]|uniref:Uncharacterized protein n=1 Tax=bioreactor metagenome TaxID=1076179 RepID=A0A645DP19_9ZZZZ